MYVWSLLPTSLTLGCFSLTQPSNVSGEHWLPRFHWCLMDSFPNTLASQKLLCFLDGRTGWCLDENFWWRLKEVWRKQKVWIYHSSIFIKRFQSKSEFVGGCLAELQNVDGQKRAFEKVLAISSLNDSLRWAIHVSKKGRAWKIKLFVIPPCCHPNSSFSHRDGDVPGHSGEERGLAFSRADSKFFHISQQKTNLWYHLLQTKKYVAFLLKDVSQTV